MTMVVRAARHTRLHGEPIHRGKYREKIVIPVKPPRVIV
jgi:hypothetical protein